MPICNIMQNCKKTCHQVPNYHGSEAFPSQLVCIQHDQLLWCFHYQTYVYSMISYYGVFSIRRMYTSWSVIKVFSASYVCIQHDQLLWCFSIRPMYTAWSVIMMFQYQTYACIIQHDQLLWCFKHQTYVYSMISYYGVFSIRSMYTAWSVIMVF